MDGQAAKLLSTQVVVVQAKDSVHCETIGGRLRLLLSSCVRLNASQHYEPRTDSATAQKKRRCEFLNYCISTDLSNPLWIFTILQLSLWETPCITAGKNVPMQQKWCGRQQTPNQ